MLQLRKKWRKNQQETNVEFKKNMIKHTTSRKSSAPRFMGAQVGPLEHDNIVPKGSSGKEGACRRKNSGEKSEQRKKNGP